MDKALANLTMFICGVPKTGPTRAYFTYIVTSGSMRSEQKTYEVSDFDATNSPNKIWGTAVAQIKTNEGIS